LPRAESRNGRPVVLDVADGVADGIRENEPEARIGLHETLEHLELGLDLGIRPDALIELVGAPAEELDRAGGAHREPELAQPAAVAPGLDDDLPVAQDGLFEEIVAVAADDDVDAGDLGKALEVGHRPQVGEADDDLTAFGPQHPGLGRGDRPEVVARKPGDHIGGEIGRVLVAEAEDADLDPFDRADDRGLKEPRQGGPLQVVIGVEHGHGDGRGAGDQAAEHSRQGVHPQVELVVPHGHGVVEAFHDLELGIAKELVEHEAADEDVPGVEGQDVRLGHLEVLDKGGHPGDAGVVPVEAAGASELVDPAFPVVRPEPGEGGRVGLVGEGQHGRVGVVRVQDGQDLRLGQARDRERQHENENRDDPPCLSCHDASSLPSEIYPQKRTTRDLPMHGMTISFPRLRVVKIMLKITASISQAERMAGGGRPQAASTAWVNAVTSAGRRTFCRRVRLDFRGHIL